MSQQDASLLQGGQARIFIQKEVGPGNQFEYYGCTELDGPSQNFGAVNQVFCPSGSQRNQWVPVGVIRKAPAMGTTGFKQHMNRNLSDIWFSLAEKGCRFNLEIVFGSCQRPDQFSAWEAKMLLKDTYLTDLKLPPLNPMAPDANDVVDLTGTINFVEMKRILRIAFGEVADTLVLGKMLAGFYYDNANCGECGIPSDGCKKQYWLEDNNPGSPGKSSQVVYTLDGGANWSQIDIPTLGGLSGTEMVPVGSYCVVFSKATNSLHYILFSDLDAGLNNWVQVTTGFVFTKSPNAAYVKSASETYVAADGGYIYKMVNPPSGVTVVTDGSISTQNMLAIDGNGNTVVAVGANNTILKSINGGLSFALLTGPAVGANLTAVACVSPSTWFVGGNVGAVAHLYYTNDYGAHWYTIATDSMTTINAIKFVDEVVGYMAVDRGVTGYVYRTTDGGNSWYSTEPSLFGLPTNRTITDVAPCGYNICTVGGSKTVGGDGLLATAK